MKNSPLHNDHGKTSTDTEANTGNEPREHATLPYTRPQRSPAALSRQYRILLLTQLSSYRDEWFFHTFFGIVLPLALVFFAQAIMPTMNTEAKIFLLGGNLAMSIAFGPPLFLLRKLGWARQDREFDYWIALPVSKTLLVLAIASMGFLFALPGLLGCYVLSTLLLGLPFSGSWMLLFLLPLSALSLTGIGVLLGSFVPNGQIASVMGNLLLTFIGFLSPMLIPLENLPPLLQYIAPFIPTTYIADALRIALGGQSTASLPFDVGVLIVTSIVLLGIAQWKIDWRSS